VTNLKRLKKIQTAPKGKIKSIYIYRTGDNCSKPNYEELECLGCLVGVHREKPQVELNKPIYVGMSVLDLSKYLMYDFYYNTIQSSIETNQNYCSLIQTVYVMRFRQKMLMKILNKLLISLIGPILRIIQILEHIMTKQTKKFQESSSLKKFPLSKSLPV
jgi:hypothetical protein